MNKLSTGIFEAKFQVHTFAVFEHLNSSLLMPAETGLFIQYSKTQTPWSQRSYKIIAIIPQASRIVSAI